MKIICQEWLPWDAVLFEGNDVLHFVWLFLKMIFIEIGITMLQWELHLWDKIELKAKRQQKCEIRTHLRELGVKLAN